MKKFPELSHGQLKRKCDIEIFNFNTTDELEELQGIMGQTRGEQAMKFGLSIEENSYHIYMSGSKGTGRTTYAKSIIEKVSRERPVPDDWCYVYNFNQPDKALALNMPAGMGRDFQKDMEEMLGELVIQVSQAFNSDDYDRQRNEISKIFQEEKNRYLSYLTNYAKEKNYVIKWSSTGFIFKPQLGEEELMEDEIAQLDESAISELEKNKQEVEEVALEVLLKIKNLERTAKKKLLLLETRVGLFVVKPIVSLLIEKYSQCNKVVNHLQKVEADLVENIYQFVLDEDEEITSDSQKVINDGFLKRYKVNLFIDNSKTAGAPMIIEFNPTLNRLTGSVEYSNENGIMKTNFLQIKPGAIHHANGGYLILEAHKLLSNPYSWDTLKRIIQTKEITVENAASQLGIIDVTSIKLEPIPIHLKVILIGSEYLYYLLTHYDEDFQKHFKILVDFNDEMERNKENELKMAQFIRSYTKAKNLRPFDRESVGRLIEYSSRLVSDQRKMSAKFNKILEIIVEANSWAAVNGHKIVSKIDMEETIKNKYYRINKHKEKTEEAFERKTILIDVKGEKVGVINGLSIINVGDYYFGKPSVITITSNPGREGIINIEREVNLSGDIYDKGVLILSGYLSERFAQEGPLTLSARICFEQSYGGVDGDSASSAELYGLLSSIGGIPIKQYIAVTGSVNQKGYIQPVGGVTEKIEGFYNICKNRGLTGRQGVIIPYQNIENLMLSDEIVEAVRENQFHIYGIKHVNEGMEIIMGEENEKIIAKVKKKLDFFRKATDEKNMNVK
ncbi:Lon protease family protein [Alkaliphilus peptidifermentans]|uniref:endopeptidase La n=1 Tax=Alkaliphilus peptidifermentans DSM 18978 TaxID=1120976 RepID=A0A1G5K2U7_9FIRM|nr:ATP-binding protein [Alkaliphilus peptidifermentans]SCY94933.1 lon-related putative ATP-dependent protease [Alkaliphilus peptidifermentans DSM 18978]